MATAQDLQLIPVTDALGNPVGDDLLIRNGDFVIGPSDEQHIQDILNAFPGWWKQFPNLGVGIFQYLNGPSTQQQTIKRSVTVQLESDGYRVDPTSFEFDLNNMLISISATRS